LTPGPSQQGRRVEPRPLRSSKAGSCLKKSKKQFLAFTMLLGVLCLTPTPLSVSLNDAVTNGQMSVCRMTISQKREK
jgi:hypothetical protein